MSEGGSVSRKEREKELIGPDYILHECRLRIPNDECIHVKNKKIKRGP